MTVVSFSMAYRSFWGGSGRLDTHLDTPPSINRRHLDSCLAPAYRRWSQISRHTFSDGADTLASARPHACSPIWRHGYAEGYERISGGNGKTAATASRNCYSVACRSSTRRSLPARRPVSGACPDIRSSNRPCATPISTVSVFPALCSCPDNPIEPPWCGPVCPVVWEGRCREASPYPDQHALKGSGKETRLSIIGPHAAGEPQW